MSTAVVDDFVKRARSILSSDELKDLALRLTEAEPQVPRKSEVKRSGKKGYVSPNTVWLRDHSAPYKGMHVALKDGKFLAAARTLKELDGQLKEMNVDRPLRAHIPREEDLFWAGWS